MLVSIAIMLVVLCIYILSNICHKIRNKEFCDSSDPQKMDNIFDPKMLSLCCIMNISVVFILVRVTKLVLLQKMIYRKIRQSV